MFDKYLVMFDKYLVMFDKYLVSYNRLKRKLNEFIQTLLCNGFHEDINSLFSVLYFILNSGKLSEYFLHIECMYSLVGA